MVLCGHVLLVSGLHLHGLVVLAVPVQCHAGLVPSVRDRGHHWAFAGPAWPQVEEGRVEGQAPRGVRSRDCHRWA